MTRLISDCSSFAPGESSLHFLSHLYAHRASALWKVPEVAEWLQSSVDASVLSQLSSRKVPTLRTRALERFASGTPQNFARHIIVTEIRSLLSFISPQAIPPSMVAYDPVPPLRPLSTYDERYFAGVTGTLHRSGGPGRARPGQWEGADDEMAQRMIQEMIMAEIQRDRGGIPGAFEPDDDVEDVDTIPPDSDEDSEGPETDAPAGDTVSSISINFILRSSHSRRLNCDNSPTSPRPEEAYCRLFTGCFGDDGAGRRMRAGAPAAQIMTHRALYTSSVSWCKKYCNSSTRDRQIPQTNIPSRPLSSTLSSWRPPRFPPFLNLLSDARYARRLCRKTVTKFLPRLVIFGIGLSNYREPGLRALLL